MTEHRVSALQRDSQWSDLSVCVVWLGVAGYSCADALMQLGASVTIVDESPGDIHQERAEVLGSLGAVIRFGEAADLPVNLFFSGFPFELTVVDLPVMGFWSSCLDSAILL